MRTLRNVIFWLHLVVGLAIGLGVALMAATGTVLAFERQIVEWTLAGIGPPPSAGAERMPIETLLAKARAIEPTVNPNGMVVRAGVGAPVDVLYPKERHMLLNAYTGELIRDGSGIHAFFRFVTELHRWLALSEENRQTGKYITGWIAIGFLLLMISGLILWIPRKLKWASIKPVLLLNFKLRGRARDWNWHNVLGAWALVPLVLLATTGTVIGFQWAGNLVLRIAGDTPPAPPPKPTTPPSTGPSTKPATPPRPPRYDGFDAAWRKAMATANASWTSAYVRINGGRQALIAIHQGDPEIPYQRATYTIDRQTTEILKTETFETMTAGQKARSLALPIHRGLVAGVAGQIVMCLASLAGLVLVYTGFALAYRRLTGRHLRPSKDKKPAEVTANAE